jgi:peptidoglycan/LPS O-acetylase OafA/YrhL
MTTAEPGKANALPERSSEKPARLYYVDWLRVLAILGVFLFHAMHPFDMFPWEIKNTETSIAVTLFIVFLGPWGMPLFFLLSGTGSRFALRRRTGRQYALERVTRLFIPFVIGSILLSPLQLYFQWRHQNEAGVFAGTLLEFLQAREISIGPRVFGWAGYHLWFLGFLFAFSLIGLPIFLWFKGDRGRRVIDWLARLCARRGGLFLFILPLVVVQFLLRPFWPAEHDWTDFVYLLAFFVSGYVLYADERFLRAIQRERWIMLVAALASTLFFFAAGAFDVATEWMETPGTPGFYLLWTMWAVNGWCWTLFMLDAGMRHLNFTNKYLQYGLETIMPFYLFHQPVIILLAYYVVQWNAGVLPKLLVVVLGSLLVSLGLVELVIKRVNVLRGLFGMKTLRSGKPSV